MRNESDTVRLRDAIRRGRALREEAFEFLRIANAHAADLDDLLRQRIAPPQTHESGTRLENRISGT